MVVSSESVRLSDLPAPDRPALEHSQRLSHRIRQAIEQNQGPISFADYMQMALYEPGLGYYSAGARKFGTAGDFVTAPELSRIFTACLARQCRQVLKTLDHPAILECGPGSGVMACDLLQILEQEDCLPEKYFMLEVSADLRQRQQQLLREKIPHLASRVIWLAQLPQEPLTGIILGNEVLDAMAVHRIMLAEGKCHELTVTQLEDRFAWTARAPAPGLQSQVSRVLGNRLPQLPEGYTTEINSGIGPWLTTLAKTLQRGVMLFIDYGYPRQEYYHPQRTTGTLLCHYRHHVHDDPFLYPGLQDITAAVDFTAMAEAAIAAGLRVHGYTTQAHFLIGCGLQAVLDDMHLAGAIEHAEAARQARWLTLPGEMGEKFKVLALSRGLDFPLAGFEPLDMRSRL